MTIEEMTTQAIRVRDAVVLAGGMATKSFIEDWLISQNNRLSRHDAHDITNSIELEQKKLTYNQDAPTPRLEHYKNIVLKGKARRASIVISIPS